MAPSGGAATAVARRPRTRRESVRARCHRKKLAEEDQNQQEQGHGGQIEDPHARPSRDRFQPDFPGCVQSPRVEGMSIHHFRRPLELPVEESPAVVWAGRIGIVEPVSEHGEDGRPERLAPRRLYDRSRTVMRMLPEFDRHCNVGCSRPPVRESGFVSDDNGGVVRGEMQAGRRPADQDQRGKQVDEQPRAVRERQGIQPACSWAAALHRKHPEDASKKPITGQHHDHGEKAKTGPCEGSHHGPPRQRRRASA